MKAIQIGNQFDICADSVTTHDELPALTYVVRFEEKSGFHLYRYPDFSVDEKVYGVHRDKVQKVMKAFDLFGRNLGVILSGGKGIGKTLFARMLAQQAAQCGLPVIIVDEYEPGIAAYLENIDQAVMILFDEFDKTFDDEIYEGCQAEMLGFFDGIHQSKKLCVVTCNDIRRLNNYFVSRPGRFHYHFRFDYPDGDEIREYLEDKLACQYWGEISHVVEFSNKVDLNYDCLRAIAFELNSGLLFKEAILDLNILHTDDYDYDLTLYYEGGETLAMKCKELDMFLTDRYQASWLYDADGDRPVKVKFNIADITHDVSRDAYMISGDKLMFEYDNIYEDKAEKFRKTRALYLQISRRKEKSICYAV